MEEEIVETSHRYSEFYFDSQSLKYLLDWLIDPSIWLLIDWLIDEKFCSRAIESIRMRCFKKKF